MKKFTKSSLKVAICAAIFSSGALADSYLQGNIIEVSDTDKSVLIDSLYQGQVRVKILPHTRVKLDDCGIFGTDFFDDGTFKDIKVGRYLEVEQYAAQPSGNNATIIPATKVEVKCYKRAY